ncbi:MAG: glycoside hydrolase family 9 protein [Lachnospiraceae bacterium]|nr:glycoside hydrolase family 9 protein [Lachnospiraceae bacterium]
MNNTKEAGFSLDETVGYFRHHGVDVIVFDDIYPEGHQGGVSIIMHGNRVATNGDIRFEPTPGQWQPVSKLTNRQLDTDNNEIKASLSYPDHDRHLQGMNPMIYPDFAFDYTVSVKGEGAAVVVTVNLKQPIPERFAGKLCFNLELFPGALFGHPWMMDESHGIFPLQPNGPILSQSPNHQFAGEYQSNQADESTPKADPRHLGGVSLPAGFSASETTNSPLTGNENDKKSDSGRMFDYNPIIADDLIALPYAVGKCLTVRPDDDSRRLRIEAKTGTLKLYDGRMNHNNGWFVVSGEIPQGVTENAIVWTITPNALADWLYPPVVQCSQVGYHPAQTKIAVIELDMRENERCKPSLFHITDQGSTHIRTVDGVEWGTFLRYRYLQFDFSDITTEGLYQIRYGEAKSSIFRIAADIYERGVWQPVLEYYLPVQMCHMLVREKYRIWHGLCHQDDARMAPINHNHFDGYVQGASTLTQFSPGDTVPGLNVGGWHDAGDYDLRVESQAGEAYILAMAYEAFGVDYDVTSICQKTRLVEIHQPDGKNDILQQIEHGALSVVGAYRALGRLYRGIIESDLRQYVLLGDAAAMTDGICGNADDRWVFTEDNPWRELMTAGRLAGIAKALRGFNDELAADTLAAAQELWDVTLPDGDYDKAAKKSGIPIANAAFVKIAKVHAASELLLATEEGKYRDFLLAEADFIAEEIENTAWMMARAWHMLEDVGFRSLIQKALPTLRETITAQNKETPYGIPYRPHIWGAGWGIQRLGFQYYFIHKAWPELFDPELIMSSLNFVLGCHPGANNCSFASGVGAKSAAAAYGINRADWSFIPGGVISGTALIRPDFPELLDFPFLWQQTEYVMGGGSSHYMFLVLAAREILGVDKT